MANPFKAVGKAASKVVGSVPGVKKVAGTIPGASKMMGFNKPNPGIGPSPAVAPTPPDTMNTPPQGPPPQFGGMNQGPPQQGMMNLQGPRINPNMAPQAGPWGQSSGPMMGQGIGPSPNMGNAGGQIDPQVMQMIRQRMMGGGVPQGPPQQGMMRPPNMNQ